MQQKEVIDEIISSLGLLKPAHRYTKSEIQRAIRKGVYRQSEFKEILVPNYPADDPILRKPITGKRAGRILLSIGRKTSFGRLSGEEKKELEQIEDFILDKAERKLDMLGETE